MPVSDGAEAEAPPSARDEGEDAEARGLAGAPVCVGLLAANAAVFAGQVLAAGSIGAVLRVPDHVLMELGANASQWTIADNRFETLLTSVFLHGSLLHLVLNLVVLRQVGPFLERAVGAARFLPLYLGAGVVGSAMSAIWGRFFGPAISVGASGAICGLIGAVLVLGMRTQGWRGPLARQMGLWLGFLLLFGLARNLQGGMVQVDNAAHLGGAAAGAILAAGWRRGFEYGRRARHAIVAACAGIVLASGVVVFVRDRTDPYLFLDVEERMRVALDALRDGQCARARQAMTRAIQMDPRNRAIRALSEEIDRECAAELAPGVVETPPPPRR